MCDSNKNSLVIRSALCLILCFFCLVLIVAIYKQSQEQRLHENKGYSETSQRYEGSMR